MKNIVRNINVLVVLLFAFSCSNDFLKDEPDFLGEGSPIAVSPDWPAEDYSIFCQGVGNAKFTISHKPEWLDVSSKSGQFNNNTAILNCKAKEHKDFSKVGIYQSRVILSVDGKGKVAIPVLYVVEGNPVVEVANRLTINFDNWNNIYFGRLSVKNTGNGILFWEIVQLPEWLSYEQLFGEGPFNPYLLPQNGEGLVKILFNTDFPLQEDLSGKIFLATNDKNKPIVEVEVKMDLGNPSLYIWEESGTINFGRTETTRNISFSNQGSNGLLAWRIEGCPEWLTVSETSGILNHYNSQSLTFTCNRDLMPPGANTVTIYLKTNDKNRPTFPITVLARGNTENPNNVKPVEGNITDAFLDKQTDILYLTTTQPNRFLAYDTKNRTVLRELTLNRAPACFSISEDGKQAVIGHSGYISSVNMEKFSIIKSIEVDYNIFDIEWGVDNWVCYTRASQQDQIYYLQWNNIDTKETYIASGYYLRSNTLIKKIPDQNYIVASQTWVSSSGIIIYDIESRNFVKDFSEDLLYFAHDGFWFSSDGNYLFSLLNKIYRTSSFFTSSYDVSPIGNFTPAPNRIFWMDHHATSNSVWVLSSSSHCYWHEEQCEVDIIQYEDNDYTCKATYSYDDFYNGRTVQAHYVFANKAGTELVVIRNATSGNFMWSLEFISIEK